MIAAAATRKSADPTEEEIALAKKIGYDVGGPQTPNLVAYDQVAGVQDFEPGFSDNETYTNNWQDILDPFAVSTASLFGGDGVQPFDLDVFGEFETETCASETADEYQEEVVTPTPLTLSSLYGMPFDATITGTKIEQDLVKYFGLSGEALQNAKEELAYIANNVTAEELNREYGIQTEGRSREEILHDIYVMVGTTYSGQDAQVVTTEPLQTTTGNNQQVENNTNNTENTVSINANGSVDPSMFPFDIPCETPAETNNTNNTEENNVLTNTASGSADPSMIPFTTPNTENFETITNKPAETAENTVSINASGSVDPSMFPFGIPCETPVETNNTEENNVATNTASGSADPSMIPFTIPNTENSETVTNKPAETAENTVSINASGSVDPSMFPVDNSALTENQKPEIVQNNNEQTQTTQTAQIQNEQQTPVSHEEQSVMPQTDDDNIVNNDSTPDTGDGCMIANNNETPPAAQEQQNEQQQPASQTQIPTTTPVTNNQNTGTNQQANSQEPPAQTNTGTSNTCGLTDAQKKIIEKLKDIRGKTQIKVEKGSIIQTKTVLKAGASINYNQRFKGDKRDSFIKINEKLLKENAGYNRLSYYLQQDICNNLSNYALNLLSTEEGSKKLKDWLEKKGIFLDRLNYQQYEDYASEYVLEQLNGIVNDIVTKHNKLKDDGKTDREIFEALIGKKSGVTDAGKGLIDLESFKKEIDKGGLYNPYPSEIPGQKFQYRVWKDKDGKIIKEVHFGVDSSNGGDKNSKIQAPLDGKVVGTKTVAGYGNTVVLEHHEKLQSHLAHLKSFEKLDKGQVVTKGLTTVGVMGNTGHGSGVHLHTDLQYSVDGQKDAFGNFYGEIIYLDAIKFSEDLKKSGLSINEFMKSQAFKTHLTNLMTFLDTTAKKYPAVNQKCNDQIKLIEKALKKFN